MLKDFTQERFDILIQAGQSNASGNGFGPTDVPYVSDGRIWYLNRNNTISLAAEYARGNSVQSNFALSFSKKYIEAGCLDEGRKILILRAALGGTGFLNNRWGLTDDLYLHMMEMIRTALSLNPENRLVALLWHQGEADALQQASFDVHYKHLNDLLQSVRSTFAVPTLPFVAGDFVQQWKEEKAEICAPVIDAIRAVCRDCGFGAFVETDGLTSNAQEHNETPTGEKEDRVHFSRRAIYELGCRYFEKYTEIVG